MLSLTCIAVWSGSDGISLNHILQCYGDYSPGLLKDLGGVKLMQVIKTLKWN